MVRLCSLTMKSLSLRALDILLLLVGLTIAPVCHAQRTQSIHLSAAPFYTAGTIYVDSTYGDDLGGQPDNPAAPYKTLFAAVAAAESGNTIEMRPGAYSYDESGVVAGAVVIDKVLHIRAAGAIIQAAGPSDVPKIYFTTGSAGSSLEGATLDGARGSSTTVPDSGLIDVSADDVTISNCHLQHCAGVAIRTGGATTSGIRIENNLIEDAFCGIACFTAPNNIKINGNTIRNAYTGAPYSGGIKISYSSGGGSGYLIENNHLSSSGEMGIEVWGGHKNVNIAHNQITATGFGISINACEDATLSGNTVRKCSYTGVEIAAGCNRVSLHGGTIDGTDETGANVTYRALSIDGNYARNSNVVVSGLTVYRSTDTSVYIYATDKLTLSNCSLTGNTSWIVNAKDYTSLKVADCDLVSFGDAAYSFLFLDAEAMDCSGATISGNHFYGGTPTAGGVQFFSNLGSARTVRDTQVVHNYTHGTGAPGGMLQNVNSAYGYVNIVGLQVRDNMPDSTQVFDAAHAFLDDGVTGASGRMLTYTTDGTHVYVSINGGTPLRIDNATAGH